MVEHVSDYRISIDIPYLTQMGQLLGVSCEYLDDKCVCCHAIRLYFSCWD